MREVKPIPHARVPIVKFVDRDTGIQCDMCVNNMLGIRNSILLRTYSKTDPRLRPLVFVVSPPLHTAPACSFPCCCVTRQAFLAHICVSAIYR